jgi:hypothetical protein
MPFTCKIGDSFYLPDNNGRHRWIILTKPNSDGHVVIVNFTDANNLACSVILTHKDNKALSLRTTINCEKAALVLESKLKLLKVKDYVYFNELLVAKIVKGVIENRHTPPYIIAELKSQHTKLQ